MHIRARTYAPTHARTHSEREEMERREEGKRGIS